MTTEETQVTTEEAKGVEITPENISVYEQAAQLVKEEKEEEAIALIREKLGEEAALDAQKALNLVNEQKAKEETTAETVEA